MTPTEWESLYLQHKDEVFRLSLNVQTRRGDPVRTRDYEALAANRAGTGLTDAEIAQRLGLPREVVMAIRLRAEKEAARPENHKLLYGIGLKRNRR